MKTGWVNSRITRWSIVPHQDQNSIVPLEFEVQPSAGLLFLAPQHRLSQADHSVRLLKRNITCTSKTLNSAPIKAYFCGCQILYLAKRSHSKILLKENDRAVPGKSPDFQKVIIFLSNVGSSLGCLTACVHLATVCTQVWNHLISKYWIFLSLICPQ